MSVEVSSGGASVGTSECRNGMHQIEESSDLRFSEEENEQFVSFDNASKVDNNAGNDAEPKIQMVPSMLRNNKNFMTYFQPKVFSFGPFYHSVRTEKMAKQIKVNLAAKFLEQNGVKKEVLYADIKKQIELLKEFYDDRLTEDRYKYKYKDHKLAWMFLVDGCAILQFMYIFVDLEADPETQFTNLKIKTDYAEFLAQDLFLLENQLPYKLLQLIIGHTKQIKPHTKEDEFRISISKERELLESIYKFIFYRFRTPEEWYRNKYRILEDLMHKHVHLLDLLRTKLIQPLHQRDGNIFTWGTRPISQYWESSKRNRNELKRNKVLVPFRNAGKLRETGINLKCSKTSCVKDIGFSGGTLKLPRIIVEESTIRMFLNMLAYEMCADFHKGSDVSTYLYFMDKLIDRTQDVEELREKNILLNELGSDGEVVKLFNEISTHLIPNDEYYKVKRNIDNYFDNKGLIWLHKISHDIHQYFKRRWSILALIGALLAVTSSIFQTVITFLAYQADSKKGI